MKTWFITGVTSGIGKALTLKVLQRGDQVVGLARRKEALEKLEGEAQAWKDQLLTLVGDVRQEAQVQDALKQGESHFGKYDVVVANAGLGYFGSFEAIPLKYHREMVETNIVGALHTLYGGIPYLQKVGGGDLCIIASVGGFMGYPRMNTYCGTKFFWVGWAEALWYELKGSSLRLHLICPGEVETGFFQKADRNQMPGAAHLVPPLKPQRVAQAVLRAVEKNKKLTILPLFLNIYLHFHRHFPKLSRFIFYNISKILEKKRASL